jgi:hypothetical protein
LSYFEPAVSWATYLDCWLVIVDVGVVVVEDVANAKLVCGRVTKLEHLALPHQENGRGAASRSEDGSETNREHVP